MLKLISILMLLTLTGCFQNKGSLDETPKLNESLMVDVLVDLHLLESHITTLRINQQLIKDSMDYYSTVIFKRHTVSITDFNESLEFYTQNPTVISSIYAKVKLKLQLIANNLPDVDESAYKITPMNRTQIINVLNKTPYVKFIQNDSSIKEIMDLKDSIYLFLKQNDSVLNNISLHSFMFNFNKICLNPNESKQLIKEINNILLNSSN